MRKGEGCFFGKSIAISSGNKAQQKTLLYCVGLEKKGKSIEMENGD